MGLLEETNDVQELQSQCSRWNRDLKSRRSPLKRHLEAVTRSTGQVTHHQDQRASRTRTRCPSEWQETQACQHRVNAMSTASTTLRSARGARTACEDAPRANSTAVQHGRERSQ